MIPSVEVARAMPTNKVPHDAFLMVVLPSLSGTPAPRLYEPTITNTIPDSAIGVGPLANFVFGWRALNINPLINGVRPLSAATQSLYGDPNLLGPVSIAVSLNDSWYDELAVHF